MTPLDVLLIESTPGEGSAAVDRLKAAGHRVHRCWAPPGERGKAERVPLRDRYLCTGVTRGSCPLDDGVDVALLVRGTARSRPTAREMAVTCAIRAGVPIIEDGVAVLDPFAPWVAAGDGDDVAAQCERAAARAFDPLRSDIKARLRPTLLAAAIDPGEVDAVIEADGAGLVIHLTGPAVDSQVEQALCVRALDAVHATRRSFDRVDVGYEVHRS